MKRVKTVDEFFERQPSCTFINALSDYEPARLFPRKKRAGEVSVLGVYLQTDSLTDAENLQTVFRDFSLFTEKNALAGNEYPLILNIADGYGKEEYEIEISAKASVITASENEGLRRGIIRFEELLCIGGGNLTIGKTREKTAVKTRISRCCYAPINRPPKNLAELDGETDYYPDGYLSRLMHDGVNAVWVYEDMDQIVRSSYIGEFGQNSEPRLQKLNALIDKCRRYGIKVFLFMIMPMSLEESTLAKRYLGIAEKYPQVRGNSSRGPAGFCTYSEFGEKYLSEAVESLVKAVPKLGGIMSITFGERVTSCGNTWPSLEGVWHNNCPYCKDKTRMEIVAHTIEIVKKAMQNAAPEMEFISWTYGHRGQPFSVIGEYVDRCPEAVAMLQNFEDDGRVEQLGKKRFALDYYLCYAGPSDMFSFTAKRAVAQNKKIYAKMQICCSHELATVPYIPVPGLVYDKMERAKSLGVTGVMESWFFGNYPCLMSKAAGMLSSAKNYLSKQEFLTELAGLYFNSDEVDAVVTAWGYFEKAYTNYPVNVSFNYYGPMHDGVVWELALLPKNFPLPRTWQLTDIPDGDRIGECLFAGHTIEEAITLTDTLKENWRKGCEALSVLPQWNGEYHEQFSVAKALGVLFDSGNNILRFYKLRDELGYGRGNACEILQEMRNIVLAEKENSKKMITLCRADNRLGYHSEAEGYKFFPEKLEKRIRALDKLLDEEFPLVEKRVRDGLLPLTYYGGDEDVKSVTAGRNGLESAPWAVLDDGVSKFRIAVGEYIEMEIQSDRQEDFCFDNEYRLMFPEPTMVIKHDGTLSFYIEAGSHQSMLDEKVGEELSKWQVECLSEKGKTHLILKIKKTDTGFIRLPYKFLICTYSNAKWCIDENPCYTLGKGILSPRDFGWIK